ncbi:taurine ABC transporter ATP binding subunit [Rhodovastum atsumiense]|uniref:ABC transporter ATP-binding protein n=1 Tax=Rhodovastum atsumiense TaxID=504468 RepID=A0A5M6ILY1_9PROT|nr:ABC transporter ATP-binding protein [Rhodovastum atsumiense]KAA5608575.1 ABC transporter ATP-binding protein [Rhodovastum atsumiense]CAH2598785.1 taurine ABC transporter ATP binding subunit [Rhodovastum atsumiense]
MTRRGRLDLAGVSKRFRVRDTDLPVLAGIDLTVDAGEFVAVIGASGCGKSTLLRLIAGLETFHAGSITCDGHPVDGPSLDRGIVFQEPRLFPWCTVAENIALGLLNAPVPAAAKRRIVAEHIALVGLSGFEDAYPYQLSGGMAHRAAIARGLVGRPGVLLLDEPFGALDALTRGRLQGELQRIWTQERITMVLVTHDVEEAVYLADRVVVLTPRPGRIAHTIAVELPHPRRRADPRLTQLRAEVLALLEESTDQPDDLPAAAAAVPPAKGQWTSLPQPSPATLP